MKGKIQEKASKPDMIPKEDICLFAEGVYANIINFFLFEFFLPYAPPF